MSIAHERSNKIPPPIKKSGTKSTFACIPWTATVGSDFFTGVGDENRITALFVLMPNTFVGLGFFTIPVAVGSGVGEEVLAALVVGVGVGVFVGVGVLCGVGVFVGGRVGVAVGGGAETARVTLFDQVAVLPVSVYLPTFNSYVPAPFLKFGSLNSIFPFMSPFHIPASSVVTEIKLPSFIDPLFQEEPLYVDPKYSVDPEAETATLNRYTVFFDTPSILAKKVNSLSVLTVGGTFEITGAAAFAV